MIIALPVWQDHVSSVLDFANRLLLVELEDGLEIGRNEILLAEQSSLERAAKLRQLGINVLICGAISRPLAYMLSGSGIDVLPFITGPTEQVLEAFREDRLDQSQFTLPGCCRGRVACRGSQHRRHGRERHSLCTIKNRNG